MTRTPRWTATTATRPYPGAIHPQTFTATVGRAYDDGLISDQEYDALLDRLPT